MPRNPEERLKAVERANRMLRKNAQHLQQVRAAVDQARRKLVETEEQKREAWRRRKRRTHGALTSSLERPKAKRASLQGRMAEIEGLDKLQTRLAVRPSCATTDR